MKKIVFIVLLIGLFSSCKKETESTLNQYVGSYYGKKRTTAHYEEFEPNNGLVSKARTDSAYYSFVVTVCGNNLIFDEYNANNIFIHQWNKIEVNNVGQLAYLKTDTTGFGNITSDTLVFMVSHKSPYPPDNNPNVDTLFYTYYYTLSK